MSRMGGFGEEEVIMIIEGIYLYIWLYMGAVVFFFLKGF